MRGGCGNDGRWVYLRTRGGTVPERALRYQHTGLSPHTRRNRIAAVWSFAVKGSISAHAEEPHRSGFPGASGGVYLHTRGGTVTNIVSDKDPKGLSPHTRRNPSIITA